MVHWDRFSLTKERTTQEVGAIPNYCKSEYRPNVILICTKSHTVTKKTNNMFKQSKLPSNIIIRLNHNHLDLIL